MLAETVQGGAQTTYLPGLDIIGQQTNGQWSFNAYDGLGSLRQITAYPTGDVKYAANYDPFGGLLDSYGTPFSSFGFTGEQSDTNGLLYLRARYYDPGIGGFLARDPIDGVLGVSNSHNGYSYVRGNPVNFADPSGQCDEAFQSNILLCGFQNVVIGTNALHDIGAASLGGLRREVERTIPLIPRAIVRAWDNFVDQGISGLHNYPQSAATNWGYAATWAREQGVCFVPGIVGAVACAGNTVEQWRLGKPVELGDALAFVPLAFHALGIVRGVRSAIGGLGPATQGAISGQQIFSQFKRWQVSKWLGGVSDVRPPMTYKEFVPQWNKFVATLGEASSSTSGTIGGNSGARSSALVPWRNGTLNRIVPTDFMTSGGGQIPAPFNAPMVEGSFENWAFAKGDLQQELMDHISNIEVRGYKPFKIAEPDVATDFLWKSNDPQGALDLIRDNDGNPSVVRREFWTTQ